MTFQRSMLWNPKNFVIFLLIVLLVLSWFHFYNTKRKDRINRWENSLDCQSKTEFQDLNNYTQQQTQHLSNVSRWVSFGDCWKDGRRLGNQIFNLAAVMYVAQLTGRTPVMISSTRKSLMLLQVFRINLEYVVDLCPCHTIGEDKSLSFDRNNEKQVFSGPETVKKSLVITGFRHSWRYTLGIENRLRQQLVFRKEFQRFAEDYLQNNIPPGWIKAGFVRVGIHSRRGDLLTKEMKQYGYAVPNAAYFKEAMQYFIQRYSRIQFIVTSDDINWFRQNIIVDQNMSSNVKLNVTYSVGHSPGQDLALLSMCDNVIISIGTFGWWGAWLAKGTVIYYGGWPKQGSKLYEIFAREEFYPPHWISMTGKNVTDG